MHVALQSLRHMVCRGNPRKIVKNQPTKICDECESLYYGETSEMTALCPECAHLLYGYKNCAHIFVDGRCLKCYWDGSISEYCKKLKREQSK